MGPPNIPMAVLAALAVALVYIPHIIQVQASQEGRLHSLLVQVADLASAAALDLTIIGGNQVVAVGLGLLGK